MEKLDGASTCVPTRFGMLTSSAPPSPSDAFHYHASRRTSTSSQASTRFQVTPARRAHHHSHSTSARSPVPAFARSPHSRKREYADAGTQYTPPGFPPTYRAPPPETSSAPAPLPPTAIAPTERGETSAAAVITEPPEPDLRVDPRPVEITHVAHPGRTTPREGDGDVQRGQQRARPDDSTSPQEEATSLAKRPRALDPNVKIMPLKYETCDVKELGVLVADMLMELVRLNDERPLQDGQLTRFHSRYGSRIHWTA